MQSRSVLPLLVTAALGAALGCSAQAPPSPASGSGGRGGSAGGSATTRPPAAGSTGSPSAGAGGGGETGSGGVAGSPGPGGNSGSGGGAGGSPGPGGNSGSGGGSAESRKAGCRHRAGRWSRYGSDKRAWRGRRGCWPDGSGATALQESRDRRVLGAERRRLAHRGPDKTREVLGRHMPGKSPLRDDRGRIHHRVLQPGERGSDPPDEFFQALRQQERLRRGPQAPLQVR